MAQLSGGLPLTGSLAGLSMYKRKDLDKIIVRTKGGATKDQIKNRSSFINTRRINKEWEGVTGMTRDIRRNIYVLKHLADYNFTGALNSLGKKMEYADTKNGWGKRSVLLSQCHYMLEGFNLNKRIVFDTVLRQPIECVIDRESNTVQLSIPAIHPAINFVNPGKNPLYRFVLMAGFVSDLIYNEKRKEYLSATEAVPASVFTCTDWVSVKKEMEAQQILLQTSETFVLEESVSIIVTVGIEFGIPVEDGSIRYVPYSGSAKVLKMG